MRVPITIAATAMSATLLKDGKKSFHRSSELMGGNSNPSTSVSVPVLELRADGLQAGVGQGDRQVAHLPHEETEVRDDDGRAEGRQRNPVGVVHRPDGQEDQAEADEVA